MAKRVRSVVIAAVTAALVAAPAVAHDRVRKGEAIYYADEFAGETMACGGKYRPRKMVAAHRKLPCGTRIRVRNRGNGRAVVLTVKDRGPYGDKGTIVDVSRRAARKLRFFDAGRAKVRLTVLHD